MVNPASDEFEAAIRSFVEEVLKYPVGQEVYVCASWIEGGPPDENEVGAQIEPEEELILHHTKTDLSLSEQAPLWAAGYRSGNEFMIRMRDMAVHPGRATSRLSGIIESVGRHVSWSPRYTYRSPSFENFDLYVARIQPNLFSRS